MLVNVKNTALTGKYAAFTENINTRTGKHDMMINSTEIKKYIFMLHMLRRI